MKKSLVLTLAFVSMCYFAGLSRAETVTQPSAPAATATATTTAPAQKATPAKAPSAQQAIQQNRMKACAEQYHQQNVPKSQYKAFMSGCLKKNAATPVSASAPGAPALQQDKMKNCNKDAKTQSLTGDARKTFMKDCLSK